MSITYTGTIVGAGAATTLPSVDSWGTNMSILKDPPKSINTRRINYVSDTQEITDMIDGSGNRICEAIKIYPRGVNPAISVNYSNSGTSGGQNRQAICSNATMASLPYKIMDKGAFRPPLMRPFDLRPLSRQPRAFTYAFCNPSMPGYIDTLSCLNQSDVHKVLNNQVLSTSTQPTAKFVIGQSLKASSDVKNAISKPINCSVSSGTGTMNWVPTNGLIPQESSINTDYKQITAQTQLGCNLVNVDSHTVKDTTKYIKENLQVPIYSSKNNNKNTTSLTELTDFDNLQLKDTLKYSVNSNTSKSYVGSEKIHKEIERPKNVPTHNAITNLVGENKVYKKSEKMPVLVRNRPIAANLNLNKKCVGDDQINNCKTVILRNRLPINNARGDSALPNMSNLKPVVNIIKNFETNKNTLAKKVKHFSERY